MREILFRGKTRTGKWVQGNYEDFPLDDGTMHTMISVWGESLYDVIPETVGQYTGLTDKNGTKIFEGDIVNIEYDTIVYNAVIEYRGASFYGSTHADLWELDNYYDIEVVGNIHDNPELMKEGA